MATEKTFEVVPWHPGDEIPTRKKRQYGKTEAARVANNRGYACSLHRKRKMKCDPEVCPRNRIFRCRRETPSPAQSSEPIDVSTHAEPVVSTDECHIDDDWMQLQISHDPCLFNKKAIPLHEPSKPTSGMSSSDASSFSQDTIEAKRSGIDQAKSKTDHEPMKSQPPGSCWWTGTFLPLFGLGTGGSRPVIGCS